MTMSKLFKQFFTPQKYSKVMIDELKIKSPKKVIDLSMGEASLLLESIKRWPKAQYFGNDIDKNCCKKIHSNHIEIDCFNLDVFKENTIKQIQKKIGKIDLCVGNPPFYLVEQNKDTRNILKQHGLSEKFNSKKIPAEVIYILQCLNILTNNGVLSLILPDGFFTNKYLSSFRKYIINNYKILNILELPNNAFKSTDAKTHIITLKKIKVKSKKIKLFKYGMLRPLFIGNDKAIQRMDYSYYERIQTYSQYKHISGLDAQFIRGKSKYLIKGIKHEHVLHTTSFSKGNIFKNKLRTKKQLENYRDKIAIPGDIIIARVGSYCIGNIGYVEKGFFVATDCIFVLRIKDINLRKNIYSMLISDKGQEWIRLNSKGVSAKHITLEDFKKFPFMDNEYGF